MAAVAVVSVVLGIGLILRGLYEWHLYGQEARMRAVEECELLARSQEDTLPDLRTDAELYRQWIEHSGVRNVADDSDDPTIPSMRIA